MKAYLQPKVKSFDMIIFSTGKPVQELKHYEKWDKYIFIHDVISTTDVTNALDYFKYFDTTRVYHSQLFPKVSIQTQAFPLREVYFIKLLSSIFPYSPDFPEDQTIDSGCLVGLIQKTLNRIPKNERIIFRDMRQVAAFLKSFLLGKIQSVRTTENELVFDVTLLKNMRSNNNNLDEPTQYQRVQCFTTEQEFLMEKESGIVHEDGERIFVYPESDKIKVELC